jgi:DNA-binding transcriptional regulator YiaG
VNARTHMTPDRIRALRHSLGLTQAEFAAALGVHTDPEARPSHGQVMVSRWERGVQTPSRWYAYRMECLAAETTAAPRESARAP